MDEEQQPLDDWENWEKQEPFKFVKEWGDTPDTSQKNDLILSTLFDEGIMYDIDEGIMSSQEMSSQEMSSQEMWAKEDFDKEMLKVLENFEEEEFPGSFPDSRPSTPPQLPRESLEKSRNEPKNKSGNEPGNKSVNAKRKVATLATNNGGAQPKSLGKKKRKKGSNLSNKKQQQKQNKKLMVSKDFIKKTVSDAVKQYNMPHFDDTFGVKIHQLVYDFCKNYGKPHTIVSLVENIRKKEESEHLPFLSWIQHHLKKLDGETLLVWTEHKHADVAYSEPVLTSKEYLYDQTKRNNPNRLSEQFGKFSYVVPTENPVSYLYVFLRHCLHMDRL